MLRYGVQCVHVCNACGVWMSRMYDFVCMVCLHEMIRVYVMVCVCEVMCVCYVLYVVYACVVCRCVCYV